MLQLLALEVVVLLCYLLWMLVQLPNEQMCLQLLRAHLLHLRMLLVLQQD